jgi:putative FmdB family regulatory protein
MPIYEFRCTKCNAYTEVFQKLSDKQPTRCRKCKGRLEKLVSKSAIKFKGEGWYVTDYARKDSVAEKVEKELASPEPASTSEKAKPKKSPAKKDST